MILYPTGLLYGNGDIMTYNATYDSNDMDDIVVDGLGTAGVQVITFMAVIILVMLFGWFKSKYKVLSK